MLVLPYDGLPTEEGTIQDITYGPLKFHQIPRTHEVDGIID